MTHRYKKITHVSLVKNMSRTELSVYISDFSTHVGSADIGFYGYELVARGPLKASGGSTVWNSVNSPLIILEVTYES